jgi:hypothetical protein
VFGKKANARVQLTLKINYLKICNAFREMQLDCVETYPLVTPRVMRKMLASIGLRPILVDNDPCPKHRGDFMGSLVRSLVKTFEPKT